MSKGNDHSITGTWLGNYYYDRVGEPHGFEAVFVQSGAQVEGSILDDGRLGEAHVNGTLAGSLLKFCKIYNGAARSPIHYEGTLSEDGKSISGSWQIDSKCRGSWMAWRLDDEKLPEEQTTDQLTVEFEHTLAPASSKSR